MAMANQSPVSSAVATYEDTDISSLYAPSTTKRSPDIVREAFNSAKTIFNVELSKCQQSSQWLESNSTFQDAYDAVTQAAATYEAKSNPKVSKWTRSLTERLLYYERVLDSLAQHHSEYVSLVWGAFKFSFMVLLNHETIIKKLAKGLCTIGNMLSDIHQLLDLYRTETMMQHAAKLYAYLLHFFWKAIAWYGQGRLSRAVGSIIRPWEIHLADDLKDVQEQHKIMIHQANTAHQGETRDIHLELFKARKGLETVNSLINNLSIQAQNQSKIIVDLSDGNQSMLKEIKLELRQHRSMISAIQVNQLLTVPLFNQIPSSGATLAFCRSLDNRVKIRRFCATESMVATLEKWSRSSSLWFLTPQSNVHDVKSFVIDLIEHIRHSDHHVLWALRFKGLWKQQFSSIDIVKVLVSQALHINSGTLQSKPTTITVASLYEACTEEDWLRILDRALHGVETIYVILDADLLGYTLSHNRHTVTKFIETLRNGISCCSVKVYLSSPNIDQAYIQRSWNEQSWETMRFINTAYEQSQKSKTRRDRVHQRNSRRAKQRPSKISLLG